MKGVRLGALLLGVLLMVVGVGDLKDLRDAVVKIRSGDAVGRGVVVRRFEVNSRMTMITLYPFGNR